MWGGWRDYIASWATPLKTADISNADVTFSINFCSYYAQPTIGRFISVASLHLLTALVWGKKRRLFHRKSDHHGEWLEALWRPKHLATPSGGERHICEAAEVVGGVMCCKTVILWLGCHGNSVSMFRTACHPRSCTLAGGRARRGRGVHATISSHPWV